MEGDWKTNGHEERIPHMINLKPKMLTKELQKFKPQMQSPKDIFNFPQAGFLKLNYDGASKGNPGQVRIGGVFCNS